MLLKPPHRSPASWKPQWRRYNKMMDFPIDFTDKPQPLKAGYDSKTDAALRILEERGLVVLHGLTAELSDQISKLALEEHIKEYCPRDCTAERFADRESTRKWLSRGHAFFSLARPKGDGWEVIGYGWSGPKTVGEVPGGKVTFAVRLAKAGLGQKLSLPFSQAIIGATAGIYHADGFWLETWQSNGGAVHVYEELGYKLVTKKASRRPTVSDGEVEDTRLFMDLA